MKFFFICVQGLERCEEKREKLQQEQEIVEIFLRNRRARRPTRIDNKTLTLIQLIEW